MTAVETELNISPKAEGHTATQVEHTTETAHQGPHISIKAEELFKVGSFSVTNSLLTSWLVVALLLGMALSYQKNKSLRNFMNLILKPIYGLLKSVFGDKIEIFFPVMMTYFIYILSLNWLGLLPGVGTLLVEVAHGKVPLFRAGTADLNTTLAFGISSIILVQYYSIKYLGIVKYLKKFINVTNPIKAFVGLLELISEISKAISFSFRLFGNIFAGEVLLTVVAFLVPVLASFPFLLFEFFVGFIQALVFSMLSSIFISVAIADHGH